MYEDRARKGAELLDRANPGWAEKIATDRLAMTSCSRCILGQLYGSYDRGAEAMGFAEDVHGEYEASEAHGFSLDLLIEETGGVSYGEMQRRYGLLADAWRAEIRERVGAGV